MNQNKSQKKKKLILEWSQYIIKGKIASYFYPLFIEKIQKIQELRICYDQYMSELLLQLLNSVDCQSFSEQQTLDNRQCLFQIANILYVEDYIGKKQYHCIMSHKKLYLVSRIELFLNICQEGQPAIEEIQHLWNTIVDVPFPQFWKKYKKMKILPTIFQRIYEQVKEMKGTEDFLAYYINQNNLKAKQQKKEQTEFYLIQKKPKQYRLVKNVQIIQKKSASSQEEDSPRPNQIYPSRNIQQKTFDYLIQNSQKYRHFQSYIQSMKSNGSRVSNYLLKIVYKQALFFNKSYAPIVLGIHTFINFLIRKLNTSKISCFQLFGSVRNNLALLEQFDVDISSIPWVEIDKEDLKVKKKQQQTLLFHLRNKLKGILSPWLSSLFVYNFQNIKVPFLKLTLNSEQMEKQFGASLSKVDITIGNQSGSKNSQLISKFMSEPSIAAFCLLIKLWAKKSNIINSKAPMKGLSSYGVTLMSLYYLMESKQINFLQLDKGFNFITDAIDPNLINCKLKSLQDNFCGFLQFYRQTGRFQKQQQIICLLKNFQDHCIFEFNHDILFNMCDFIDKTNPGRYRYDQKKAIYSKFQTSIRAMKQDINIIKDLFGDKS